MHPVSSLQIIYASTSGHTEYVVGVVQTCLMAAEIRESPLQINIVRAESAQPEDLQKGDVLLLASGTWNTGGIEGQLNPHMFDFLIGRAKDCDLNKKPVAIIALGDERYFYTARAGEHLRRFVLDHNGTVLGDTLAVVNEPYGQEERVKKWTGQLLSFLAS